MMQNFKIYIKKKKKDKFSCHDSKNMVISVDTSEGELEQMTGLKSKIIEKWTSE